MSKPKPTSRSFMQTRRSLLLLPLLFAASSLMAETTDSGTVAPLPNGACPLNSGGPSLLGSRWRLFSVYGNQVPSELEITMEVGENALKGMAGCNNYTANFQRVGHTGFKINNIDKGRQGCPVLRPGPGLPSINVGDWEGSYIRTLQRAGSVEQRGNSLQFYNRSGEPSVVFTKKYGDGSADSTTSSATPVAEANTEVADATDAKTDETSLVNKLSKLLTGRE